MAHTIFPSGDDKAAERVVRETLTSISKHDNAGVSFRLSLVGSFSLTHAALRTYGQ